MNPALADLIARTMTRTAALASTRKGSSDRYQPEATRTTPETEKSATLDEALRRWKQIYGDTAMSAATPQPEPPPLPDLTPPQNTQSRGAQIFDSSLTAAARGFGGAPAALVEKLAAQRQADLASNQDRTLKEHELASERFRDLIEMQKGREGTQRQGLQQLITLLQEERLGQADAAKPMISAKSLDASLPDVPIPASGAPQIIAALIRADRSGGEAMIDLSTIDPSYPPGLVPLVRAIPILSARESRAASETNARAQRESVIDRDNRDNAARDAKDILGRAATRALEIERGRAAMHIKRRNGAAGAYDSVPGTTKRIPKEATEAEIDALVKQWGGPSKEDFSQALAMEQSLRAEAGIPQVPGASSAAPGAPVPAATGPGAVPGAPASSGNPAVDLFGLAFGEEYYQNLREAQRDKALITR